MFVNRYAELQLLEQRYSSGQAELFVLYGSNRSQTITIMTWQ